MLRAFFKAMTCAVLCAISLQAAAIFHNGGFESGDFSGWTTGYGTNNGLTGSQPFTSASINLGSGGSFRGAVVSAGPDLVGAPITLPHVGGRTARVNNGDTGGYANFISQTDVITNADRDAGDQKLHVRFDYAVVLENPGHDPDEQPFFFVRVRDVTAGTTLYEDFSFAGQTGTQFQPLANTSYAYLNWKGADVVVPDASVGHSIEVYLLASDCSPSAHLGYAYLDGFGSQVVTPPPSSRPAVPAPMFDEMALIGLGLLLLGAAVVSMRRA